MNKLFSFLYKLSMCIVMALCLYISLDLIYGVTPSTAAGIIVSVVCFIELLQRLIITIYMDAIRAQ